MKKIYCILVIFTAITLGASGTAFAVPCSQGGVSGSVSCQDGLNNNDNVAGGLAGTVNDESFFTFDDWIYLEKYDVDTDTLETIIDYDWTVTPDGGSWPSDTGEWSFSSSVWDDFIDVMIVVKTGKNRVNGTETFFSGYLLDNSVEPTSGTWDTGDKDLSHLTLYARRSVAIPEPATMLLLGFGLIGLAGLGRKRLIKKT